MVHVTKVTYVAFALHDGKQDFIQNFKLGQLNLFLVGNSCFSDFYIP